MLSDKQIDKFQELYEKHFGEKISRENACDKGNMLIRLVDEVYKPKTNED